MTYPLLYTIPYDTIGMVAVGSKNLCFLVRYRYMEELIEPLSQQTKEQLGGRKQQKQEKKKYSILEILIVISAIAVVCLLALLAINPSKKGAESRNLQRKADLSYILAEVSAYSRSREGIPDVIPISDECVRFGNEICKMGPYDCTDFVDLSILNDTDSEDLVQIPVDPLYISLKGTGYYIYQDGQGAITVCAPYAERNEKISFTKYLY
jgi:type II secretory pathway pseudopilin PulG